LRSTRSGRLTMDDLPHPLALGRVGPVIDDRLLLAVALRDLAGPIQEQRPIQPIELRIVERPFLDVPRNHGLAVTVCRVRSELAGATPGTVAVRVLHTTKHPAISHRPSLFHK